MWLAGARTELGTGRLEVARSLLHRAFQEVPDKSRAHVFLECSRLEVRLFMMHSSLEKRRTESYSNSQRLKPLKKRKEQGPVFGNVAHSSHCGVKLQEFCGHVDRARRILVRSRQETRAEWKVRFVSRY